MQFDLHLRSTVREQFQSVAQEMRDWQTQAQIGDEEAEFIRQNILFFNHTTSRQDLRVAGVDGSGDFPMLSYSDSFIYLSVAQGTVYEATTPQIGLREVSPVPEPVLECHWIPEDDVRGVEAINRAFEQLAKTSILEIIKRSDYQQIKYQATRKKYSAEELVAGLIRPHASDTSNLAIQLRSTAEMAAALQLIEGTHRPNYILTDTTFSLPFVSSKANSLFHEHLKRLCCVEARKQETGFFALSKSHGLATTELVEKLACELQGLAAGQTAEHWCLRIPNARRDEWSLSLVKGRNVPPLGAVSYLVRFHRTTPLMRLDMDAEYWQKFVAGETKEETRSREQQIFEDLDYTCHDQRVYGYPYPIKAAHDRASLTNAERVALRKQLISAAVAEGMSPALFRDPSTATGHR
ncbi:hypothetical protein H6G89_23365 [Oscillatoria sp. FACHB-1407]|uniref:hypothetical protein n=1 Tax=Oscillatoria sp. FACHB-1407 TaxID=2692847 RepID=UPI001681F8DB|nr:hypothetical protein [Oscillatoria sp. FACHB-1407]MBD2463945.1 hypothetical protein [Oscillatoria sp. FACHB-1407]